MLINRLPLVFHFLFFIVLLLVLGSCKKDSDSKPSNDEYIEFELDGVLHRIANNPTGILTISGINQQFSGTGSTQKHAGYPDDYVLAVSFAAGVDENIQKHKIYNQDTPNGVGVMVFTITKPPGTKVKSFLSGNGAWEFHITQFSGKGKVSEGTFSYQSVKELNQNDSVVATNHSITNGKFKLLVHE